MAPICIEMWDRNFTWFLVAIYRVFITRIIRFVFMVIGGILQLHVEFGIVRWQWQFSSYTLNEILFSHEIDNFEFSICDLYDSRNVGNNSWAATTTTKCLIKSVAKCIPVNIRWYTVTQYLCCKLLRPKFHEPNYKLIDVSMVFETCLFSALFIGL